MARKVDPHVTNGARAMATYLRLKVPETATSAHLLGDVAKTLAARKRGGKPVHTDPMGDARKLAELYSRTLDREPAREFMAEKLEVPVHEVSEAKDRLKDQELYPRVLKARGEWSKLGSYSGLIEARKAELVELAKEKEAQQKRVNELKGIRETTLQNEGNKVIDADKAAVSKSAILRITAPTESLGAAQEALETVNSHIVRAQDSINETQGKIDGTHTRLLKLYDDVERGVAESNELAHPDPEQWKGPHHLDIIATHAGVPRLNNGDIRTNEGVGRVSFAAEKRGLIKDEDEFDTIRASLHSPDIFIAHSFGGEPEVLESSWENAGGNGELLETFRTRVTDVAANLHELAVRRDEAQNELDMAKFGQRGKFKREIRKIDTAIKGGYGQIFDMHAQLRGLSENGMPEAVEVPGGVVHQPDELIPVHPPKGLPVAPQPSVGFEHDEPLDFPPLDRIATAYNVPRQFKDEPIEGAENRIGAEVTTKVGREAWERGLRSIQPRKYIAHLWGVPETDLHHVITSDNLHDLSDAILGHVNARNAISWSRHSLNKEDAEEE